MFHFVMRTNARPAITIVAPNAVLIDVKDSHAKNLPRQVWLKDNSLCEIIFFGLQPYKVSVTETITASMTSATTPLTSTTKMSSTEIPVQPTQAPITNYSSTTSRSTPQQSTEQDTSTLRTTSIPVSTQTTATTKATTTKTVSESTSERTATQSRTTTKSSTVTPSPSLSCRETLTQLCNACWQHSTLLQEMVK